MTNRNPTADNQSAMRPRTAEPAVQTQSQNLILVLTTYALDPNRAILTRLLIELDQKFILLPIERLTKQPVKIAKPDLILIDAVHLRHAGRSSRVTKLLFDYEGARAVVGDTGNPGSHPDPARFVSHGQLRQQLPLRAFVDFPAVTDVTAVHRYQTASPKADFFGPQGVDPQTRNSELMPANPIALFDQKLAIERARGQPDLAMDLYDLLKVSLKQDLFDIALALQENDLSQAQRALHKLSGALALTGAPQLEQAVKIAKKAIKGGENLGAMRSVILAGEQLLALMTHAPWSRSSQ